MNSILGRDKKMIIGCIVEVLVIFAITYVCNRIALSSSIASEDKALASGVSILVVAAGFSFRAYFIARIHERYKLILAFALILHVMFILYLEFMRGLFGALY